MEVALIGIVLDHDTSVLRRTATYERGHLKDAKHETPHAIHVISVECVAWTTR